MTVAPIALKGSHDSRTAKKFVVRMHEGMHDAVKLCAGADGASLNTTVVKVLHHALFDSGRQALYLDALGVGLAALGIEVPAVERHTFGRGDTPRTELDKFVVRLPPGMREALSERANLLGRSMNSTILMAIEDYLFAQARNAAMTDALEAHANQLQVQEAAA